MKPGVVKSLFFFQELDPCESKPCENSGNCTSESGEYTCQCSAGFEGDHCEISEYMGKCYSGDIVR